MRTEAIFFFPSKKNRVFTGVARKVENWLFPICTNALGAHAGGVLLAADVGYWKSGYAQASVQARREVQALGPPGKGQKVGGMRGVDGK